MTRAELLARMTASEFMEWRVLEQVEPFGERADYFRAGIIASTMANVNRDDKTPPYSASDFMPDFDDAPVKTPEQLDDILTAMQAIQGHRLADHDG